MCLLNDLINNQVSELFAIFCFLAGSGIMWAIMMDGKDRVITTMDRHSFTVGDRIIIHKTNERSK